MEVRQGVVQPLAAGAAVDVHGIAALLQCGLDGQHGIRIVLFHRGTVDVGKVRLLHGVKISQQQVRNDTRLLTGPVACVGGNDEVAGDRTLPQAEKGTGGKKETALHRKSPSQNLFG